MSKLQGYAQVDPPDQASVLTNSDPVAFSAAIQNGGSIRLAFAGTVKLHSTLFILTNTTIDASGHTVSLDGSTTMRHFVVTNDVTLRLVNLTLANGRFLGSDGETNLPGNVGYGGAILNLGGALELNRCTFTNNQATGGNGGPRLFNIPYVTEIPTAGGPAYGGAIYSSEGQVWATNCLFVANTAQGGNGTLWRDYTVPGGNALGGAVFCSNSQAIILGTTFVENLAQAGEFSQGRPLAGGGRSFGGAYAHRAGVSSLSNCVFILNRALGATKVASYLQETGSANGGALFQDAGKLIISGSLLTHNSATGGFGIDRGIMPWIAADGNGGAVCNESGTLHMTDSALISNQAIGGSEARFLPGVITGARGGTGSGGAIYNRAEMKIVNCTLVDNQARGGEGSTFVAGSGGWAYGGAIFNTNGALSLINVTICSNVVQIGPTGRPTSGDPGAGALGSSIFSTGGSVWLGNTIQCSGAAQINFSGTVIDGGHNISSDSSASFTLPSSRNDLDPLLAPLAYNGGPTPTMALLPSSPAINAGDDSVCPPTDQRGVRRPQGLASDIGAFELAPTLALVSSGQGKFQVTYVFKTGETNRFSASANLAGWSSLGIKRADTNGATEIEEIDLKQTPERFYKVEAPGVP